MPYHLLCYLCSPNRTGTADAPKNLTVRNLCHAQPVVNGLLHPIRHRDGADVPSFSDQVNDGLMVFATRNVIHSQIDEFSPTESTTQEHRQDGSIPSTFDRVHARKVPQSAGFLHG